MKPPYLIVATLAALLHTASSLEHDKNGVHRSKRQTSADQMVQNILQWLQGLYSQNSRKIRQGSFREYLPPSNTQKPRPFEPAGYPPSGITPQPPFRIFTNPTTGAVTGEGYPSPDLPPNNDIIPPNQQPDYNGYGQSSQPQPPFNLPGSTITTGGYPGFTLPAGRPTQPAPGFPTSRPSDIPTERPTVPAGFPSQPPEVGPTIGPGFPAQPAEGEHTIQPGYPSQPPVEGPTTGQPGLSPQPPLSGPTLPPSFPSQPPTDLPGFPSRPPFGGVEDSTDLPQIFRPGTLPPGFPTPAVPGVPTLTTSGYPSEQPGFPTEGTGVSTQPEQPGPPSELPGRFPTGTTAYPTGAPEGSPPQPPQEPTEQPESPSQTPQPGPGSGPPEIPAEPEPTPEAQPGSPTEPPLPGLATLIPGPGPELPGTPTEVPGLPGFSDLPPSGFTTAPAERPESPTNVPPGPGPKFPTVPPVPVTLPPGAVTQSGPPVEATPPPEVNTIPVGLGETSTTRVPSEDDLRHPPHIHAIDVQCAKDMMTINIEFNRPFDGVIYSKGYFSNPECRYVQENTSQTKYSFTVSLNSCGTEFIDAFETQGQSYLENILVLQNEPGIQEVWDTIRSVRCLWEGNLKESLSVGLSVGMLNQEIITFSGDTAMAKLDVVLGRSAFGQPANGLVKIGEQMTLVVSVSGDPGFDVQVKDCRATDSTGTNTVQLTDDDGCILKPKLFGAFQKTRNTGNTGASIIAFAYFNAFKFPDVMDLMIECNIELCKTDCEMCSQQDQALEPSKRKRRDLSSTNQTQLTHNDGLIMSKHLTVILPEDLNTDTAEIVLNNSKDSICMSLHNFVFSLALLISLLISSCLFSIYLWIQNSRLYHKN